MSSKPVLFFSKRSDSCKQLWAKLASEGKLDMFIKICIEDNPTKIPPMIKEVPSIYIKDRPVISGFGINMFLSTLPSAAVMAPTGVGLSNAPNQTPSMQNTNGNQVPHVATSTNGLNGIGDFNPIEMSSNWSDSYSFIQDNPCPMGFCYEFLGNDGGNQGSNQNNGQYSNNGHSSQQQKMQRTNDFNSKLEELQRERSNLKF